MRRDCASCQKNSTAASALPLREDGAYGDLDLLAALALHGSARIDEEGHVTGPPALRPVGEGWVG